MTIVLRGATALVLCLGLSACATITRGSKQEVTFISTPEGARMVANNGVSCPSTPCTIKVPRKNSFDATFTKDGYKPVTVKVFSNMAGDSAVPLVGNAIIGGVIGVAVDATSGALNDLTPNPVTATLQPVATASAGGN